MDKNPAETKNVKIRYAHANFRKGLHDYNDGANVVHWLGNEAYVTTGLNLPDPTIEVNNEKLDGKVAEGNEFIDDEEDET